jgi:hypothetical protein
MITRTLAAGIVAITALSAVPASAASLNVQFGHGPGWGHHGQHDRDWRRHVSPNDVRRILQRDGYRAVRVFDRRGAVYQARASKHGRHYVIVVSARNGKILSRHRV